MVRQSELRGRAESDKGFISRTSYYQVTLNTAPLGGHPAGPFSVLVVLIDGNGIGDSNNTVAITDVSFGGGNSLAGPGLFGGAHGSLENGVSMN